MSERIKFLVPAALAVVLVLGAALSAAAAAEEEPEGGKERAEDLAREGAERLMEAFEALLKAIPQYGMPRVDEDGNIVIPRLDGQEDQPPGESPPAEDTEPFMEETAANSL